MHIAVKSTGGITEYYIHVDNVDEGIREAAKQIAEDYGLCRPTSSCGRTTPTAGRRASSANSASSRWTAPATSSNSTERAAVAPRSGCYATRPPTAARERLAGQPRARTAGGVKSRPSRAALTRRT